jgi:hypothetical protein
VLLAPPKFVESIILEGTENKAVLVGAVYTTTMLFAQASDSWMLLYVLHCDSHQLMKRSMLILGLLYSWPKERVTESPSGFRCSMSIAQFRASAAGPSRRERRGDRYGEQLSVSRHFRVLRSQIVGRALKSDRGRRVREQEPF